jgi:hypothetical protein
VPRKERKELPSGLLAELERQTEVLAYELRRQNMDKSRYKSARDRAKRRLQALADVQRQLPELRRKVRAK